MLQWVPPKASEAAGVQISTLVTEESLLKGDLSSAFPWLPPRGLHQYQSSKQAKIGEFHLRRLVTLLWGGGFAPNHR